MSGRKLATWQWIGLAVLGIVLILSVLSMMGSSVGRSFESASYALDQQAPMAPEFAMEEESLMAFDAVGGSSSGFANERVEASTNNQAAQSRLIIRTGDLSIVVVDTEASLDAIAQLANELGGWVVNSSTNRYDTAVRGNITIRIPAESFDDVMGGVKGLALEVTSENSTGQDVTEEFVDLGARLGNLEATAERVRGFLDETQTVEEALAVNVELGRLEGDIEVIKGRMKYLSESAAFSTISIYLTPDELNQPIEIAGWQPQGIAKDAIEALVETLQGLGSVMIWLALYLLPVALIVGVPLYFIGRWVRRRWLANRSVQSSD